MYEVMYIMCACMCLYVSFHIELYIIIRCNLIFTFRFRLSRRFSLKTPFTICFAQQSKIERSEIVLQSYSQKEGIYHYIDFK